MRQKDKDKSRRILHHLGHAIIQIAGYHWDCHYALVLVLDSYLNFMTA
jgi:hypothetical protein